LAARASLTTPRDGYHTQVYTLDGAAAAVLLTLPRLYTLQCGYG
jgi:predicted aspartyl protease